MGRKSSFNKIMILGADNIQYVDMRIAQYACIGAQFYIVMDQWEATDITQSHRILINVIPTIKLFR